MALRIVRCPLKSERREQAIILDGNDCSAVRKGSGGRLVCTGAEQDRRTGGCLTQQRHVWKASLGYSHGHYLVVSQDSKPN